MKKCNNSEFKPEEKSPNSTSMFVSKTRKKWVEQSSKPGKTCSCHNRAGSQKNSSGTKPEVK
jgi:hypothetical protein